MSQQDRLDHLERLMGQRVVYRAAGTTRDRTGDGGNPWSVEVHGVVIGWGIDHRGTRVDIDGVGYFDLAGVMLEDDEVVPAGPRAVNYTGADESIECAYAPCTNRLRRVLGDERQWCCPEHRDASGAAATRPATMRP